jgi:hypothetical protein
VGFLDTRLLQRRARSRLGVVAGEIDYPNFKNAVAERQGRARSRVYGRVWNLLLELQRRAGDG